MKTAQEHTAEIAGIVLPETIVFDMQPYGQTVLGNLRLGEYNGYPCLHGNVISGNETSRLFQFSSTKPAMVGGLRTIYGIRRSEIESGLAVRIAS